MAVGYAALFCLLLPLRAGQAVSQTDGTSPEPPKVTAVRFWSLMDTTRIAIEATAQFQFRSDRLQNPERLFFDLVGKPDMGPKGTKIIAVGDRLVRQIRIAETQRGVTRVVLDLSAEVKFSTSQLSNPDRLIIDVHPLNQVAQFRPPPMAPAFSERAVERTPERLRNSAPVLDPPDASVLGRRGKIKPLSPDPLASVATATVPVPRYVPAPVKVEAVDSSPMPTATLSSSITNTPNTFPEIGLPAK
ncbi:MAG: AMIN domain-containing protein, partial [Acidobacteriota bacterium]|nr:AMIN domain-containing protein [Acidobacteriota bacterium]